MIETSISDLSTAEIVNHIKNEVQKRKHKTEPSAAIHTIVSDTAKSHNNISLNIPVPQPFVVKDHYEFADFTKYHDTVFINNVYRGILKRKPDVQGMQRYLHLLRSGERSKMEIISAIRYSKEGKVKNVNLLGSKKRYIVSVLYRLPVIGYISKTLVTLATLPKLLKRINQYESYLTLHNGIANENALLIQEAINKKSDRMEVEALHTNLESKSDRMEVEALRINLESKYDRKDIEALSAKFENKVDKEATAIQEKLKSVVYENTLIEVQKDIESKLNRKVDIQGADLASSLEICADDFLKEAINKFYYPVADFDKFNKEELYYSLFENVFYNSEVVKNKQKVYLKYIPKHNSKALKHLDVGCGRGEFLTNLTEQNIYCKGIDINSIEIQTLSDNGLNVENIDLINYLTNTRNMHSSISALQVVEHLDYKTLKMFLQLSYSRISKNGTIILETINPQNILAFNSFYMDETHKRPLPPEMLAFLLQWVGFSDIKFVYTALLPEEYRVSDQRKNYHDYAVIGYKV